MAEQSIIHASGVIHHYDHKTHAWVPSRGPGIGSVEIYHNPSTNAYRVIGRSSEREIAINSNVWRNLKYQQVTPVWHQWTDRQRVTWGLNFKSDADAMRFSEAMMSTVRKLQDNSDMVSVSSAITTNSAVARASRPPPPSHRPAPPTSSNPASPRPASMASGNPLSPSARQNGASAASRRPPPSPRADADGKTYSRSASNGNLVDPSAVSTPPTSPNVLKTRRSSNGKSGTPTEEFRVILREELDAMKADLLAQFRAELDARLPRS